MKTNDQFKQNPNNCPRCDSDRVDHDTLDFDEGKVFQPAFCKACALSWYGVYTLDCYQVRA